MLNKTEKGVACPLLVTGSYFAYTCRPACRVNKKTEQKKNNNTKL